MAEHDPNNPEHVRRAKAKERLAFETHAEDLKNLMKHTWGRRIAWWLIANSGAFQSMFTGNSYTYYNEGRADYGRLIMDELAGNCPEEFMTMLRDHYVAGLTQDKEQ